MDWHPGAICRMIQIIRERQALVPPSAISKCIDWQVIKDALEKESKVYEWHLPTQPPPTKKNYRAIWDEIYNTWQKASDDKSKDSFNLPNMSKPQLSLIYEEIQNMKVGYESAIGNKYVLPNVVHEGEYRPPAGAIGQSFVKFLQILPQESIPPLNFQPKIPLSSIRLGEIKNCPVHFYRYLYLTTGEPWLWNDRRTMSDEELKDLITKPNISIHVLCVDEVPSGYLELSWNQSPNDGSIGDVQVEYFGLFPDKLGLRLGPWLLHSGITHIRQTEPKARIWVHTCSWDHPRALENYKKIGFKEYKEEVEPMLIPPGSSRPPFAFPVGDDDYN